MLQSDDTGVFELQEVIEFAVGAFGVDKVLKSIDNLLDGHHPTSALVSPPKNNAIGAPPHLLLDLILLVDLVVHLLGLFHSEIIINKQFFENHQALTQPDRI